MNVWSRAGGDDLPRAGARASTVENVRCMTSGEASWGLHLLGSSFAADVVDL